MLNKGMGALVRDLTDRGTWKNTVLVCMGEFGRTPRINQNAGRDHWARCWSVVVGGGAIKGGQIFGATDKQGTDVKGDEVATVGDLFATIYKGLGLDPAQQIRDNLGRPLPIADGNRSRPWFSRSASDGIRSESIPDLVDRAVERALLGPPTVVKKIALRERCAPAGTLRRQAGARGRLSWQRAFRKVPSPLPKLLRLRPSAGPAKSIE